MFKLGIKWLQRLTTLSLLGVGVVCLLSLTATWQQRYLVQSQRVNLEQLPADQVLPATRALAAQGPHALPEIVAALASMQASVATAAQQVVMEELERLESTDARNTGPGCLNLAEALATHALNFGPTTTHFAAHLAERLLRGDHDTLSSAERMRLIEACDTVIQHASQQLDVAQLARSADLNWQEIPPPVPWEATLALLREEGAITKAAELATLADAGLAPAGVDVPSLPDSALSSMISSPDEIAPRRLSEVTESIASETYDRPEKFRKPLELRRLPKKETPSDSALPQTADEGNAPRLLEPRESAVREALPSRSRTGRANGAPRDETMIRLLAALIDADQQAANSAATALADRGLPKAHLALAKRLADPDPAVRKTLIDILPRTAGLDARPWLLWLARDDDAGVRLAAMSTLATSQDPKLCEQIEQLARDDYDERIIALADRLAKRRSGR